MKREDEPIKLPDDFEETMAALLAVSPEKDSDESEDDEAQATADSAGSE